MSVQVQVPVNGFLQTITVDVKLVPTMQKLVAHVTRVVKVVDRTFVPVRIMAVDTPPFFEIAINSDGDDDDNLQRLSCTLTLSGATYRIDVARTKTQHEEEEENVNEDDVEEEIAEIILIACDVNRSDFIEWSEFMAADSVFGFVVGNEAHRALFCALDEDKDGRISVQDLCASYATFPNTLRAMLRQIKETWKKLEIAREADVAHTALQQQRAKVRLLEAELQLSRRTTETMEMELSTLGVRGPPWWTNPMTTNAMTMMPTERPARFTSSDLQLKKY
eukprot:PhM_4_TR12524/c0_g1_i1/m.68952